jgi:hypothetical protein
MVDNMINGIYGNITRINPETLSAEAKYFMRSLREDLKQRLSIDKNLGNLVAKTLIKYHNDKGEQILPLVVELITVSFFVTERLRKLAIKVSEYLILGTIFATLTITEEEKEIADIIEQLIVAIYTNPIYEFDYKERASLTKTIYQTIGYIEILDKFAHSFTAYLPLIKRSLLEGLEQSLEICNVTAEELNNSKNEKLFQLDLFWGKLKFFINFAWPMFNLNLNSVVKWINKKTGIEIWPLE